MSCPDGTKRSRHHWCDEGDHHGHRLDDWLYRQHIRRLYLREKLLLDQRIAIAAQPTPAPPVQQQTTSNPLLFAALALAVLALVLAARRA